MRFDVVEAKGLVKLYGPTRALSGVSARFVAGRVTAVEGPNGSGKSTLLSLLSLMARPTRGCLLFGKYDSAKYPVLRGQIGVLAHAAMVYPELTGVENLNFVASLYGVANPDRTIAELRERFELGRFAERPTQTYSRGQLQRVALARAVLHRPQLLLLDEPSTGLDVSSTERLCQAIAVERERGAIVVLVTHDPALSEQLADGYVKLVRGRLLQDSQGSQGPDPAPRGGNP